MNLGENGKQMLKSWMPPVLLEKILYFRALWVYRTLKPLLLGNAKLKNSHKGERCFLLGSGPSIKTQNLKPLKDEVVFALNNFYVHPDFHEIMGGNRQKYYVLAPTHAITTRQEWIDWLTDMAKHVPASATLLFGINWYKDNIISIIQERGLFNKHEIHWYFPAIDSIGPRYRYSEKDFDPCRPIIYGGAVSVYALVWALYCGFSEIYLLGMDHNYFLHDDTKEMRMYSRAVHQSNDLQKAPCDNFYVNEFLRQYKIFAQYKLIDESHKGVIFNASAGGVLKVFQKVDLGSLFSKS